MKKLFVILILVISIVIVCISSALTYRFSNRVRYFKQTYYNKSLSGSFKIPGGTTFNKEGIFVEFEKSRQPVDIPKIIHHTAMSDKRKWPTVWTPCYNSWKKYFPEDEYEYMFWSDNDLEELITEDFPWFLDIYLSYKKHKLPIF